MLLSYKQEAPVETAVRNRKIARYTVYAVAAVYLILISARVISNPGKYFEDFRIYYYASTAMQHGENPYSMKILASLSGRTMNNGFLYPPHVNYIFAPLTMLPVNAAAAAWAALKIAFFAALVFIWIKILGIKGDYHIFILFCLLAFGRTFYIDLKTGNVSTAEQFLMWAGVFFFLKRNYAAFSALIIASASFKLLPAALLLLYVMRGGKKEWICFGASLAAIALLGALSYFAWPEMTVKFLATAGKVDERGGINPCSLALLRDIFRGSTPAIANLAYAVFAGTAAALFWLALRKKSADNGLLYTLFFIVFYAAVAPRFKDYSYIMLIAPAYFILGKFLKGVWFYAALFAFTVKILFFLRGMAGGYYFYFLTLIMFGMFFALSFKPAPGSRDAANP